LAQGRAMDVAVDPAVDVDLGVGGEIAADDHFGSDDRQARPALGALGRHARRGLSLREHLMLLALPRGCRAPPSPNTKASLYRARHDMPENEGCCHPLREALKQYWGPAS